MSPEPYTEEEEALLDRMARGVVERRLEVPAIFMLESMKPLSFVGSQLMVFFAPVVGAFYQGPTYDRIAKLLERRGTMEILIRKIEAAMDAPPDDGGEAKDG